MSDSKRPLLIAQITDIHLGFDPGNPDELNRQRLDQTIAALREMQPSPDLLLITGDLADAGEDETSYAQLKEALSGWPTPIWFCMGNHDGRAAFRRQFPHVPDADGFIQYAVEEFDLRILAIDTLEEGRHGGGFCETRGAWLKQQLDEQPRRPTLIMLHHPPIESGLSWMTENPEAPWVRRLHAIIAGTTNVVALISGHLHRPVVTQWAGTTLIVCPSTAPQVAFDLGQIDPDVPDDRAMIVADPPGFAIHHWNGERLATHFDFAGQKTVLARYGPTLQPLVRMLAAENNST